jgi:hypothetical protein
MYEPLFEESQVFSVLFILEQHSRLFDDALSKRQFTQVRVELV